MEDLDDDEDEDEITNEDEDGWEVTNPLLVANPKLSDSGQVDILIQIAANHSISYVSGRNLTSLQTLAAWLPVLI